MARMHLFEIEDQSWCPRFVRETSTDFLLGLYNVLNIYEPAFKKIAETLAKTKVNAIVDCCSGSGGTIPHLRNYLDKNNSSDVVINLTDKFPNEARFSQLEAAYPNKIIGCKISQDATKLPANFKGMRTFFSSFHHFRPEHARKILQDAVNNNAPIGVFECSRRHPIDFLRALISPVMLLAIVPFAKQLTWKKFFFTYILPITPFTNMWDYIASNFRTYSSKELHQLISQLDAPGYHWEVGQLWSKKATCYVPYLIGYKAQ